MVEVENCISVPNSLFSLVAKSGLPASLKFFIEKSIILQNHHAQHTMLNSFDLQVVLVNITIIVLLCVYTCIQ